MSWYSINHSQSDIYLIALILDTCLYIFIGTFSLVSQKEEEELPESCTHVHDQDVSHDHLDLKPVWDGDASDSDHGPH